MDWKKKGVSIILILIMLALTIYPTKVKAQGLVPDEENGVQTVKVTAYTTNDPDAICASGCKPREGICAGADWMLYDTEDGGNWVAMVWTEDGTEFLGYYELLDRGGTDAIRDGYVLDFYFTSLSDCKDWMEKTQGKCLVKYVKSYG